MPKLPRRAAQATLNLTAKCLAADQEISKILMDPAACVAADSLDFWFLVAALKAFVGGEGGGRLPLEVPRRPPLAAAAQHSLRPPCFLLPTRTSVFRCVFIMCSCPGQGSIPDMAATTDLYLQLQRIYREQAEADVSAVEAHLHKILQAHGRVALCLS